MCVANIFKKKSIVSIMKDIWWTNRQGKKKLH